jgi:tetraacyldisaccharide-1-P 4'-kinase
MNLNPLSAIYAGVIGARNALYDRGWLRTHSVQGSVISVGNLSMGG